MAAICRLWNRFLHVAGISEILQFLAGYVSFLRNVGRSRTPPTSNEGVNNSAIKSNFYRSYDPSCLVLQPSHTGWISDLALGSVCFWSLVTIDYIDQRAQSRKSIWAINNLRLLRILVDQAPWDFQCWRNIFESLCSIV